MKVHKIPLISIIVVTYNSSKYVLETLDSAYNQTYENIELIITDDCSIDDTVGICKEWVDSHKERFVRTKILTIQKNTGIPANLNRGLFSAVGEWVKFIAGDDILMSDCLKENIDYSIENKDANFIFSKAHSFGSMSNEVNLVSNYFNYDFFSLDFKEQYKYLILKSNPVPASTGFLSRKRLLKLDGFDERIRLLEDYPFWIKATKNSEKLHFFNKETIKYRVHDNSISQKDLGKGYYESNYELFKIYKCPYLLRKNPFILYDTYLVFKSKMTSSIFFKNLFILLRITSPYAYYKLVLKLF